MRTPKFWYKKKGLLSYILYPVGLIYKLIVQYRINNANPKKLEKPVICVGNINAGGSGKTPNVIKLAQELKKTGLNPHIILRGYGRENNNEILVNPLKNIVKEVGDEALILSKYASTWVTNNRQQTVIKAIKQGADIIILDDGLQNPNIYKDINIVIIDGNNGLGNNSFMPSGPLRESLKNVLKRSDAFIIMGDDNHNLKEKVNETPCIHARLIPDTVITNKLSEKPIYAFAGIGLPDKLKKTLKEIGADIKEFHPFPDHYNYSNQEIEKMIKHAKDKNYQIVTTEKDIVKIDKKYHADIIALPIAVEWENNQIMDIINAKIN